MVCHDFNQTAYYQAHFSRSLTDIDVEGRKHSRILNYLRLQPGERVLDVGCGPGALAAAMGDCGVEAVGVDMSPVAIREAQATYPKIHFLVVDGIELDQVFEPGTFDAVTCVQVLEHIPSERVNLFIGQLARILQEGGRLLVDVPVTDNLSDKWLMFRNQHLRGLHRPSGAIDSSFIPTHLWRIGDLDALMERFGIHDLQPEQVHKLYYVPWILKRLGWERLVERLPSRWLEQSLKGGTVLFRKGSAQETSRTVTFSAFWSDPPGTQGLARLKKLLA